MRSLNVLWHLQGEEKMVHEVDEILGFKDPNIWSLGFSEKNLSRGFYGVARKLTGILWNYLREKNFRASSSTRGQNDFETREKNFPGLRKHH